jgi:hypothetical protein
MKRTLLAVGIAILLSTMFAPHKADWELDIWGHRWVSCRWLLFDKTYQVLWRDFYLQTAFVALLAAVLVNLLPRNVRTRQAKVRMLVVTVASSIAILLLIGFSSRSSPPSFPQPPLKAADKDFRQIDLGLIEPYDFKMNWLGQGEGWVRNKSTDPLDALDIHVDIKNFAGDTVTSESHTVRVHIAPGQAAPIVFKLSKSPGDFYLLGPPQSESVPPEVRRQFEGDLQWDWTWYLEAAGTKK